MTQTETNENKKEIFEHINISSSPTPKSLMTITMGNGDFFEKIFSYPFVVKLYKNYSVNGAYLNMDATKREYIRRGIFLRQIINTKGVRINFQIVRQNNGYSVQDVPNLCELVAKIFDTGICNNIDIDTIDDTTCPEAVPVIPVTDFDFFNSCNAEEVCDTGLFGINLFDLECNNDYNFLTDVFDWRFCLFCNQEMIREGFNGCAGCVRWYILFGIYKRAPFNRFGQYIDLDYVACANELYELKTYRQVVTWLLTFGFSSRETKLVVPQLQSALSKNLRATNFRENYNIATIVDKVINTEGTSPQGAYNLANCISNPNTYEAELDFVWNPDNLIPWANIRNNSNTNVSTTNTARTTRSNTYTRNIRNNQPIRSRILAQQNEVLTIDPNTATNQNVNTMNYMYEEDINDTQENTTKCENCVSSYNGLSQLNGKVNFVTPLTFTLNQTNRSLSNSGRSSYLLRRKIVNGETDISFNPISVINGTAPRVFGGVSGGGNNIIASTYYDTGRSTNLWNPSRRAYFS